MYPRAFVTLRVAQFSLKIAHLSFSMGPRGPRAYGLRPRLWLLLLLNFRTLLLPVRAPKIHAKFRTVNFRTLNIRVVAKASIVINIVLFCLVF